MAIHLVGETIHAKRAHLRAQSGELIQLVRGVYVDSDGDAETAILGHAVRIAHYLYPNAYLSSASAVLLAPTPLRAGPSCGLPGQAPEQRALGQDSIGENSQSGSGFNRR